MSIQIRPLHMRDLAAVHEIEQMSFSDPWTRRMFLSEITAQNRSQARVAVDTRTDTIAGYCFYWVIEEDDIQITNIAVHPRYRKQGIAISLIEETIAYAHQHPIEGITLEVRQSNKAARSLYEKFGFTETGRRRNYYRRPKEDAIILRLPVEKAELKQAELAHDRLNLDYKD